jgi:hypothetical protein
LDENGATDLIGTISKSSLHNLQHLGGSTTPLPIIYVMTLHGGYIQMALFPATQNWESCYFKTLDIHIFSNQAYLDHAREIYYIP